MKREELRLITVDIIKEAAKNYDPRNFSPKSVAKNTEVEIDNKRYPVKAIGAIAYNLAYKKELALNTFTTLEMQRFFEHLKSDNIKIVRMNTPSQYNIDFFEAAEFSLFHHISTFEKQYRGAEQKSIDNSEIIKQVFEKSNYWAELVANTIPTFSFKPDNFWQISGNFKPYAWARLFLKDQEDKYVFFTLGAEGFDGGSLLIKLDCQRSQKNALGADEVGKIDDYIKNNDVRQLRITASEIESYDWDSLVKVSKAFIVDNLNHYQNAINIIYPNTFTDFDNHKAEGEMITEHSLNTILYGPPGTGKTFTTIEKSVAIANPKFRFKKNDGSYVGREEIRKEYQRLCDLGQIEFITFHQSLSYEDFIEGIKPKTTGDNKDKVVYETKPGIFTRISFKALKNIYSYYQKKTNTTSFVDFNTLYIDFINDVQRKAAIDQFVFTTMSGSRLRYDRMWNDTTMVVFFEFNSNSKKDKPGTEPFKVRLEKIKALYDNNVPKIVKKLKDEVGPIVKYNEPVYYAVYKEFLEFLESQYPGYSIKDSAENEDIDLTGLELNHSSDYEKLLNQTSDLLDGEDKSKIKADNFVIIIDEINRGNVSQIFGELITLIEEDKRFRKKEELKLSLSYSGSEFSVPPNLFIIGTMNTADRSVEALDTALRRRFSFIEMPPIGNHELVSKRFLINSIPINFQEVLLTINRRLEKILGRDHKIGHSYLIDSEKNKKWNYYLYAFLDKIVPLLQEYFYGDYSKMCLVLGRGFVDLVDQKDDEKFFADVDYDGKEELAEKRVWKIKKIVNESDFANALILLLNK